MTISTYVFGKKEDIKILWWISWCVTHWLWSQINKDLPSGICATLNNLLSSLSFPFFQSILRLFTIKLVLGLNKKLPVNAKLKVCSYLMIRKMCFLHRMPYTHPLFLSPWISRPVTPLNQLAINWSAFYPFTPAEIINSVVGFVWNTLLAESFYIKKKMNVNISFKELPWRFSPSG